MRAVAAVAVLLLVAACQAPPPPEMSGAEAVQELTPLFEAYNAGILSGDLEAVTTLYASDPLEIGPGAYRTLDDIVTDYGGALEAWTFTVFEIEPFEAWVHGDAAYVISRVDISGEAEGGATFVEELYSSMRLVIENGEWRIHRNVFGPREAPLEG